MKTNLFYLVVLFFLVLSNNVVAQDEFYSDKKTTETKSVRTDSVDISTYSTAEDYKAVENVEENTTNEDVDSPDNYRGYRDENSHEEKRRKRDRNEFVANVMVDVFINVVFIVATFWH